MNIGEFSKRTGLSPHTLRYYEKIGLLRGVRRNPSGHRDYSSKDAEWVGFINRLKQTGMTLHNILEYARLREQGIDTASQRQALLREHYALLEQRIATELEHRAALQSKIEYYDSIIK